ncbi:MAG: transglutaminase-like domain-containing protein [Planctomycetota bacterium]
MVRSRLLFMWLAIALCASIAPGAEWKIVREHWYALEIGGSRAGHSHEIVERNADQVRITSTTSMRMQRFDADVAIDIVEVSIERDDGTPVLLSSSSKMSKQDKSTTWRFDGDSVEIETADGGRERTTRRELPEGDWMMPWASSEFVMQRAASGADVIEVRTMSIDQGMNIVPSRLTKLTEEVSTFDGRDVPVMVFRVESADTAGLNVISKFSEDGVLTEQVIDLPMGEMVSRLVTKEQALNGGGPAPEIMVSMFVPLERALPRLDRTRHLTLEIRAKDGELPELPSVGAQRVTRHDDGRSARVLIDLDDPVPATDDERADVAYREASAIIDSDDPMIKALARKATRRKGDDPMKRAEAMRALAERHVSRKGFETAFASASETARLRRGDCSEHAVLLAAMLRADGIPSRTATGLVYVEGMGPEKYAYGWHMWTQALIDGAWIDLDATLPLTYHVGHLLVDTNSLADDAPAEGINGLLRLLGNLEIDVVERGSD